MRLTKIMTRQHWPWCESPLLDATQRIVVLGGSLLTCVLWVQLSKARITARQLDGMDREARERNLE